MPGSTRGENVPRTQKGPASCRCVSSCECRVLIQQRTRPPLHAFYPHDNGLASKCLTRDTALAARSRAADGQHPHERIQHTLCRPLPRATDCRVSLARIERAPLEALSHAVRHTGGPRALYSPPPFIHIHTDDINSVGGGSAPPTYAHVAICSERVAYSAASAPFFFFCLMGSLSASSTPSSSITLSVLNSGGAMPVIYVSVCACTHMSMCAHSCTRMHIDTGTHAHTLPTHTCVCTLTSTHMRASRDRKPEEDPWA